jgi:hypothetical protein
MYNPWENICDTQAALLSEESPLWNVGSDDSVCADWFDRNEEGAERGSITFAGGLLGETAQNALDDFQADVCNAQ